MADYTLYLDESDVKGSLKCFCLCGCIIKDEDYKNIEYEVANLKKEVFGADFDGVLHEFQIRRKEKYPYTILQDEEKEIEFYSRLRDVFINNEFDIIGSSINKSEYKKLYPLNHKGRNVYYITLQVVIENFTHFLGVKNSTGKIVAENRSDFKKLTSCFYNIMANGTLYLSRRTIQARIEGLTFKKKKDKVAGLEIADWIANPINRECSCISQSPNNIYDLINSKLYGGIHDMKERYGLRKLLNTDS